MIPTIIFVLWFIIIILNSLIHNKIINILIKNNKGNLWYCWWKIWLSYRFFKKFIDEGNFDPKQKQRYILLYQGGFYIRLTVFILSILIFFFCYLDYMAVYHM